MNKEYEVIVSLLIMAPSAEAAQRYAQEETEEFAGIAGDIYQPPRLRRYEAMRDGDG